jgi:hypothetical protein
LKLEETFKRLEDLAKDETEKLRKINTIINYIAEDIFLGNIDLDIEIAKPDVKPHIANSVDGSMYQVDIGDIYLIIARAVKITGIYSEKREIPPEIVEDFKIVSDYYGIDTAKKDAILLMLSLETKLLETCNSDIIFIDGPLVDPPVFSDQIYGKTVLENLTYQRSQIFNKNYDKVVGIVKRFSQRFLINYLLSEGYSQIESTMERFFVSNLISKLRNKKGIKNNASVFLGWINWDKIFQESIVDDLENTKMAYLKYRENLNYTIFSAYYQYDTISPISRIDVLGLNSPSNLQNFITAWGASGYSEVTVLNKLADNFSEISKDEANAYAKLLFSKIKRDINPSDIVMMRRSPNDL